jgi:acyl-CoA synthetase (NDP forming)
LAEDSVFNAVLLVLVASPVAARLWTERIANVAADIKKPIVVLWSGGRGLDNWRDQLLKAGVPVFLQATVCIRSLSAYFGIGRKAPDGKASANSDDARNQRAIEFLRSRAKQGIAEPEAKELVKLYGIPVPQEFLAHSEEEAIEMFRTLRGPVAMKVISPDILHRSDSGFVRLGISTPDDAGQCYRDLIKLASSLLPHALLQGVLVQEMVRGTLETLAGISHDPQFGPVVLFGSGGVTAELLNDVSMRLCPLSVEDCYEMISETKIGKLLRGYRSRPGGDIEGVVKVLMKLSELASGLGRVVKEMDINPLIVKEKGQGVVAVDVRLVVPSDFMEDRVSWR